MKQGLQTVFSFILISFTIQLSYAQATWQQKADFSGKARSGAVSFVIDGYAYAGTGYDSINQLNDFWKYDPSNDTWTKIADFPGNARQQAIAFTIGNKGYVGTGVSGPYNATTLYKDFWSYDPATNTWTQIADFGSTARKGAVAFVINGKAYIGTGQDDTKYQNDLWEYDPSTNQWTQKANLSSDGRIGAVAFSINGIGYIGTGFMYDGASITTNNLYAYNPTTNTWLEKMFAHSALGRQNGISVVLNGKAYIGNGDGKNDFWSYDPATNILTQESNFGPANEDERSQAIAFTVYNQAYVGLGIYYPTWNTSDYKEDIWILSSPTKPIAPDSLTISANPHYNYSVNLSWKDLSVNEENFIVEKSKTGVDSTFTVEITLQANSTSYTSYDLDENTTYYYRVKAVNSIGSSDYSSIISITTPIALPAEFWASPVSKNRIELSWKNQSKLVKNIILERSSDTTGNFKEIGVLTPDVNSYDDNNLSEGTSYFYRLKITGTTQVSDTLYYPHTMSATPNSNLGAWTRKKDLGFSFSGEIGFSLRGKGYAVLYNNNFWHYDAGQDTWAKIDSLPIEKRSYMRSFVIGDTAYVGGGRGDNDYTSDYWKYSPATGKWVQIANAPASYTQTSFAIGNKGYLMTQYELLEYDPATNTWTSKKMFPGTARFNYTAFTIDSVVYVGCGYYSGNSFKDFWKYSPATNTWIRIADFPGKVTRGAVTFTLQGKGYIATGDQSYFEESQAVWEYDPLIDQWTRKADFIGGPKAFAVGFVLNDIGYLIGDYSGSKEVYAFSPGATNSPTKLTYEFNQNDEHILSWRDNTDDESEYIVERTLFGTDNYTTISTLPANTSQYIDQDIATGKSYEYRVYARSATSLSGHSNTIAILAGPSMLTGYGYRDYIQLNWKDTLSDITEFIVERAEEGTSQFTAIDTFSSYSESINYDDGQLQPESIYHYRIRALYQGNVSKPSEISLGTNLISPSDFSVITNVNGFNELSWTDQSAKEDFYIIERSYNNMYAFEILDTLEANITFYTDQDTLDMGTYYYKIKAAGSYGASLYAETNIYYTSSVGDTTDGKDTDEPGEENTDGEDTDNPGDGDPQVVTGITDTAEDLIRIYPNPGSGIYCLQAEGMPIPILHIYDAYGRLIRTIPLSPDKTFSLEDQPGGIYLIKIEANHKIFVEKVIKK